VRTGNNQADLEGKPLQVVQAATVMAVRSGAARADHRAWGPDRRPDDSRAAARSGSPLTVTPTDDQASGAGPRRKESFRHTGRVTVETHGAVYSATYELLPGAGALRLVETDQRIRLGAFREEQAARILLREAIAFGLIEQTEHGQGLAQEVNETA
jgi:hypothetical protein